MEPFAHTYPPNEEAKRPRFNKPNRSQLHLLPISIDQRVEDHRLARYLGIEKWRRKIGHAFGKSATSNGQ